MAILDPVEHYCVIKEKLMGNRVQIAGGTATEMECRSCSGEEKLAGKKASCLILRLAQEWDPSKAQHPVEWYLKVLVCTTRRLRQLGD